MEVRDTILTESVVDHGWLENKSGESGRGGFGESCLPRKNNLFLPDFRSHDDEFPRISRGYDTFCIHAAGHVPTLLILREEGASSSWGNDNSVTKVLNSTKRFII